MKKYSSDSFTDAAVRVYGSEADTITSFPASIIANGGNITPWTVYGNTVEGVSVGDRTNNLFDYKTAYASYIDESGNISTTANNINTWNYFTNDDINKTITVSLYVSSISSNYIRVQGQVNGEYISGNAINAGSTGFTEITVIPTAVTDRWRLTYGTGEPDVVINQVMVAVSATRADYEPYGYKLPVVIGSNTTNIYMADVLRKSTGADPVYDIMSSNGVITRNVDTDGTPLETPTTESFTAPTLATVAGSQSVSFDTTIKPSKAELTYTGWHTHTDMKYSGGSWGTVTSNAKKKKSLLGSRKTTKGKT